MPSADADPPLLAVVAALLAARDAEVARLPFVGHLGERADLEVAPAHPGGHEVAGGVPGEQRPPFLAHPGQVERLAGSGCVRLRRFNDEAQPGPAVCAMREQEGDGPLDATVLRG